MLLVGLVSPVTEQPVLGWLEIRDSYGKWESVPTLPDGRSTVLADWLPPELAPLAANRHGVAVPVEAMGYISPEPADKAGRRDRQKRNGKGRG